jgi:hypothetical protein
MRDHRSRGAPPLARRRPRASATSTSSTPATAPTARPAGVRRDRRRACAPARGARRPRKRPSSAASARSRPRCRRSSACSIASPPPCPRSNSRSSHATLPRCSSPPSWRLRRLAPSSRPSLRLPNPDVLRAIVEEQRDRGRAEDRSVRLFLESVHAEYAIDGSREAFARTFRRYSLEDLRDRAPVSRPRCRCKVQVCDRYFAAVVRDVHEVGGAGRSAHCRQRCCEARLAMRVPTRLSARRTSMPIPSAACTKVSTCSPRPGRCHRRLHPRWSARAQAARPVHPRRLSKPYVGSYER